MNLSFSSDIGNTHISADITKNSIEGMSVKSGDYTVSFKKGECEATITYKIGNTTYTAKLSYGGNLVFEEKLDTELESGNVTSKIGIKRIENNKWNDLPEPIQSNEESAEQLIPSLPNQYLQSPVSIYDIDIDKNQLQEIIKHWDDLLAAYGAAFTVDALSPMLALCFI